MLLVGLRENVNFVLCPSQFCQARDPRWCFRVCMPHGGYDEDDHSIELELVKIIMEEEDGSEGFPDGWRPRHRFEIGN